ncbi:hypothetical protein Tco_0137327, partial [Tanacetum coccineum]
MLSFLLLIQRYVVPTGKDSSIVSTGSTKVIPAGSTILVLGWTFSKALDADLVDTESIRTDSTVQDDSSMSGNDTDADDANIRPIYNEEPMTE